MSISPKSVKIPSCRRFFQFGEPFRTRLSLAFLIFAAVFVFSTGSAYADSIVSVSISGVTFTGKSVSETLSASFEWDNTTNSYVAGSLTASTTGPVGPFSVNALLPELITSPDQVEFALEDSATDLIGVDLGETSNQLTVGTYSLETSTVPPAAGAAIAALICDGTPCTTDYSTTTISGSSFTGALATSGTVRVSLVPEPSTELMLGIGLLSLVGLAWLTGPRRPSAVRRADSLA